MLLSVTKSIGTIFIPDLQMTVETITRKFSINQKKVWNAEVLHDNKNGTCLNITGNQLNITAKTLPASSHPNRTVVVVAEDVENCSWFSVYGSYNGCNYSHCHMKSQENIAGQIWCRYLCDRVERIFINGVKFGQHAHSSMVTLCEVAVINENYIIM